MSVLLDVQDLKVRFHTPEGTVYAVNGISYTLDAGETLAVVGESGCGKSVSVMSLLDLIPIPPGEIVSGRAVYRGRDLLALPEDELNDIRGSQISMVFQDPMTSLNPVLTIGWQITESLRKHQAMNREQARGRAITLLEWVGIPDAARQLDQYPHQFSGGMRQRVMIAVALSCNPTLLIADEPTTALDVTIQAQIVELAQKMQAELQMAIIWITHDLGVVAGLADRVIVMYAGYIVEEAPVEELYANPRHPYTGALMAALPRADRRRGGHLTSIPGSPPSMFVEPMGCPFAPRCTYVRPRCLERNPSLDPVNGEHRIACWVDITTGELR
jgi:oligopeptide transport system ATP-binding protein